MNFLRLIFLVTITFVSKSIHAKLPLTWVTEKHYQHELSDFIGPASSLNTHKDFHEMFELSNNIIEIKPSDKKRLGKKSPWYLDSISTEFAAESTGNIGFLGAEGEAAIKLAWTRTQTSIDELKKKHGLTFNKSSRKNKSKEDFFELDSQISLNSLQDRIDSISTYIEKTKKVKNIFNFRSQFSNRIHQMQMLAQKFEKLPMAMHWRPTKLEVELSIDGSGMISPFIGIGTVLQLQIVWSLHPHITNDFDGIEDALTANKNFLLKSLDAHLEKIFFRSHIDSLYQLEEVGISMGTDWEGNLGIASGEFASSGKLIFHRDAPQNTNLLAPIDNGICDSPHSKDLKFYYSHPLINNNKVYQSSLRLESICHGFNKISDISNFIVNQASKHEQRRDSTKKERTFELGEIELSYSIGLSGSFIIATVTEEASLSLLYAKYEKNQKGKNL